MKTAFSLFLSFTFVVTSFSCSSSSSDDETAPEESVDDFQYLVLRRGDPSRLYSLGNVTGNVEEIGAVPGMGFNLHFNTTAQTPTKVFIYEQNYDPLRGFIFEYNKSSGVFTKKAIDIPEEVFGESPSLSSLDWDSVNNRLIAIITSDAGYAYGISRLAEINPETLEVTSLNIEFGQSFVVNSTTLINSKLYVSVVDENQFDEQLDFIEIDIDENNFQSLDFDNSGGALTQLVSNGSNTTVFGYKFIGGNSCEPFILNMNTGVYQNLLPNQEIDGFNNGVKSYYDSSRRIFCSLTGNSILEHDVLSGETTQVIIKDFGSVQGGAIIDIVN